VVNVLVMELANMNQMNLQEDRHPLLMAMVLLKAVSITYSTCVGSLSYPACKEHVPYYLVWPVWLYDIFPHYLIHGTIKKK